VGLNASLFELVTFSSSFQVGRVVYGIVSELPETFFSHKEQDFN